jgi:hypothetical protein
VPKIQPAIIVDIGTIFEKETDPVTGLDVIGMETYFVPDVKM